MKLLISPLNRLVTDVVRTATSKERIKQLSHIHLYSNAVYVMIATAVSAPLGFIFWIIAARFYSPEDVGLASATIAAIGLVVNFSQLGLGAGLIRFLAHAGKNANSMINAVFTIGTLVSITTTLIFIAGLSFWSPALLMIRENGVYLATFVVSAIASTLSLLTDNTFLAERRAALALVRGLIFSLLKLLLLILLAVFFHSFGIFASWSISMVVVVLLSMFLLLPRIQPGYHPFFAVSRTAVNDLLHFSFANYVGDLFWSSSVSVLPILVVNLIGAEANAYFYIAWSVGGMLNMIPNAIASSLFIEGSYDEEKLGLNIRRSLKMLFFILVPTVILILAIADKVLILFGGSYSENATSLLRIITISVFPFAINVLYLGIKRVEKKMKVIVGLTACTAIITLGLAYLLLPRMGINGAGIAWLTSQGVIALVIVASSLKKGWLRGIPKL